MGAQCSSRRNARDDPVEPSILQHRPEPLPAERIVVAGPGDSLVASSCREDPPEEEESEMVLVVSSRLSASVLLIVDDEPAPVAAAPLTCPGLPSVDNPSSSLIPAPPPDATVPPAACAVVTMLITEEIVCIPMADKFGRLVNGQGAPHPGDGCSFLIGPVNHQCCYLTLESHPSLRLPRLRVDGRKHPFSDQTLAEALVTMEQIVERREPLTVTYDLRSICLPNLKQVKLGIAWCGEHKESLDESIQGITVILSSWVVARLCNFVLSVLKPPQPTKICSDETEAVCFLAAKCQTARSWGGGATRKALKGNSTRTGAGPPSPAMASGDDDELVATARSMTVGSPGLA